MCIVTPVFDRPKWHLHCLWNKKGIPTKDQLFDLIYEWALKHKNTLEEATYIVLERQLKQKFIVMNTVLRTLYRGKVVMAHPNTVAKFFGMSIRREHKKKEAIAIAEAVTNSKIKGRKSDDIADAYLMALKQLCDCGAIDRGELFCLIPQNNNNNVVRGGKIRKRNGS